MTIALDPRYFVEIPNPSATSRGTLTNAQVYLRRRLLVGLALCAVAVTVCLGGRALANRGDVHASIPTVTPQTISASAPGLSTDIDISAAFVQGEGFYVVQPGDTMWSIASSLTDGNIGRFVNKMMDLNGGSRVDVGQRLILPEV